MPGALRKPSDLAAVVDNLREGVQVIGPDWRYLHLNPAAAVHARQPVEAMLGRTMMECYPGIASTPLFRTLEGVMDTGEPASFVNEFAYPDGKTGLFDLRAQRVPMGIVVLSIDVTEQRRMEVNLRNAMRMESLGRLAGSVAHDFNNLLTIITGYTSFLAEVPSDPQFAHDIEQIGAAARRAANLTSQLLAFARRKPVTPSAVDPWRLTVELLAMSSPALGHGITVEHREHGPLPPVFMDPGALEQVLLNLLLNARDAMDGAGRLLVEGTEIVLPDENDRRSGKPERPGRYVVLSVTDTGIGLGPDLIGRVFEPFFSTKGEGGTGLGLASSLGLVEQAGGTITVESVPGMGATFRVYLPVAEQLPQPWTPQPPPPRSIGQERVLVVDNDATVLLLTVRALRAYGYETNGTTEVAEALRLLRDGPAPHVLITDIRPSASMSGEQLADAARAASPGLRVLLLSGFGPPSPTGTKKRHDVLAKPFSPAALADGVRVLLDGPAG